jgi:hypothetical protein
MDSNVVEFPTASRRAHSQKPQRSKNERTVEVAVAPSVPVSVTGRNHRLRQHRYDVWRMIDTQKDYWEGRMDFNDVLWRAQRDGLPDALRYPAVEHEDRWPLLEKYREALAKQLLTPAPTVALVNWKQAALASGKHIHTSVSSPRLERAIADDLAWLDAHPVRQSRRRSDRGG